MDNGFRVWNELRQALCGLPVAHVWRGYGSALFLEFGKLKLPDRTRRDGSTLEPRGQFGLMIEWSWRIENATSIKCGSWSDEELWQPAFDLLLGRRVIDIETFGRLPEIVLTLSDDIYLASFMTSEGDPEWALFDRDNIDHEVKVSLSCKAGKLHVEPAQCNKTEPDAAIRAKNPSGA